MRIFIQLFFLMMFISMPLKASMSTDDFISECLNGEDKMEVVGNLNGSNEELLNTFLDYGSKALIKGHCWGVMQSSVDAARLSVEMFKPSIDLFNTCKEISLDGLILQTKRYLDENIDTNYKSPTRLLLNVIRDNYNIKNSANACGLLPD